MKEDNWLMVIEEKNKENSEIRRAKETYESEEKPSNDHKWLSKQFNRKLSTHPGRAL